MTTRNPINEEVQHDKTTVDPDIDDAEILENVEVPYDRVPDSVTQVNAVVTHPESGRCVRRMVVRDDENEVVYDTEVGLVDGDEVYRIDRGWAEYTDEPEKVYVPALDGVSDDEDDAKMTVERFARLVGFDRPGRKLGVGFEEAIHDADGTLVP